MPNDSMDIASQRREYLSAGLRRAQLDADPVRQFEHWLKQASAEGLQDPTAMTLATVDAQGRPCQRVVLLKGLDQRGWVFYTNLHSRKALHIEAHAAVCLHFGWLVQNRQVIVEGVATRVGRDEDAAYFSSRPRESQLAAWASQQSQPIADRASLEQRVETVRERFAAEQTLPTPAFWGGFRVAPQRVEFWQGRENRLHDRFIYTRSDTGWVIERWQP